MILFKLRRRVSTENYFFNVVNVTLIHEFTWKSHKITMDSNCNTKMRKYLSFLSYNLQWNYNIPPWSNIWYFPFLCVRQKACTFSGHDVQYVVHTKVHFFSWTNVYAFCETTNPAARTVCTLYRAHNAQCFCTTISVFSCLYLLSCFQQY